MNTTKILIWVAVVGVVFAFLWWRGYLLRLSNYWQETLVELKKCTWPTWQELWQSTVLVSIAILILGVFTIVVDFVFFHIQSYIAKI